MTSSTSKAIRVLYIEDDASLRDVISNFLGLVGGYEVRCANDGKEGVEKAESWKPDFILMDVRMPVMDGIEATRTLRAKPETSGIPIFALTAYSDDGTLSSCAEAGTNGHFTKPPDFQLIVATIREVLDGSWSC